MTRILHGTTAKLLAAHRFYERNGFEELPREALSEALPAMAVDPGLHRLDILGQDA